jgi:hypothetical protein
LSGLLVPGWLLIDQGELESLGGDEQIVTLPEAEHCGRECARSVHVTPEERRAAQNIYDWPEFFATYSRFPRSVHGIDGAAEWPAIRALLANLDGKPVLDLGCGFAWVESRVNDSAAQRRSVMAPMFERRRSTSTETGHIQPHSK